MSESMYPIIKNEQEVKDMINKNLNTQRAQKIVEKIEQLQRQLEHYKKISRRWKITGKIVRVLNLSITSLIAVALGVLAIMATQGVAIPPMPMAILGGYSAIETTILEGMNIGVIKKKKHKYVKKCSVIQDYLNKMHYYFEKARQDGVITLEELEGFDSLVSIFEGKMLNKNVEVDEKFDLMALKKEAEVEAKKEAAVEMKEKLKKEAKAKLLSNVVS